jgi:gluconolactonase
MFAFAKKGVPAALRCDAVGNVYAACGDGVEVWNAGGRAMGLIEMASECSHHMMISHRTKDVC